MAGLRISKDHRRTAAARVRFNHKRVLRLMREVNLLCLRRRAFVVTTDSGHNLPVYPNLARGLRPGGINQLWVADITYIRLRTEFVYLAVVLDAFSRRVIGWALGRTLEAKLAIAGRIRLHGLLPRARRIHNRRVANSSQGRRNPSFLRKRVRPYRLRYELQWIPIRIQPCAQ